MGLALESQLQPETSNKTEGEQLGEAMAECLESVPDNPLTRTVNFAGIWFAFGSLLIGTILKRVIVLAQLKMQMQQPQQEPPQRTQPPTNSRADSFLDNVPTGASYTGG